MEPTAKGKQYIKRILRSFGTTENIKRTAYVLRDGSQITYRGTNACAHSGMVRSAGATDIEEFLCATGAIKLHAWPGENIVHACAFHPTAQQREIIGKFVRSPLRDPVHTTVEVTLNARETGKAMHRKYGGSCSFDRATADSVVACIIKHGRLPAKSPERKSSQPARRSSSSAR